MTLPARRSARATTMPELLGHVLLQAGGDDRRLGDQQRHRLPLHVRAHERAVGVVVLQERDQAGRDADHLLGRDVDVLHLVGSTISKSPPKRAMTRSP